MYTPFTIVAVVPLKNSFFWLEVHYVENGTVDAMTNALKIGKCQKTGYLVIGSANTLLEV